MELTYRGKTYQKAPFNIELANKQFIGQYRGQDCYRDIYRLESVSNKVLPLRKYRGAEYGGKLSGVNPVAKEVPNNAFRIELPHQQKPVRSSRHQVMSELDKVHNDFLLKNLELRLSSARQKGDTSLVHMLEQEKEQLA